MGDLEELRRLEGSMTYVRWFGVVVGAVSIALQRDWPQGSERPLAWGLMTALALGSLVIWGLNGRIATTHDHRRLGAAAFAFDAVVIMASVWLFSFQEPYVVWALLFVLPMEGALRYRLRGALAGALLVGVFFLAQTLRVAARPDAGFDLFVYVFVVALAVLIAGVTGSMAENWYRQSVAARLQSEQLAEFDQMKDRFLAVTSHEIRGPVTAIIAGIDTIRRRGDRLTPDQHEKLLAVVAEQGGQLARLVDDLLATSQLQTGKLTLHPDWIDLQETIGHALEGAAVTRRGHQLEVFVEPLVCELDGARIQQIVRNLVENGYKYTPDRSTVTVSAKARDGGVEIEVADDGEGIPEEKRGQLFEAFSRIAETSAGREGVGLGLYVVSHLTHAMGGHIDLTSSSRGTSFSIFVPCAVKGDRPALGVIDGGS